MKEKDKECIDIIETAMTAMTATTATNNAKRDIKDSVYRMSDKIWSGSMQF
jgi:hypothetical protein